MAIVVLQHEETCRPGRLGATLRDHGFKLDIRRLDRGDPVPGDLDNVHGVVSLGGHQNVDDGHQWLAREKEFLKAAHEASLPVVGVCLGCQLIAAALGGEVAKMSQPEMGYVEVSLTAAGQTDVILSGIPWRSPQFSHHRYEVSKLPPGAVALASSARCKVQAFRAGMRTYAFQYHFEADRTMADALIQQGRADLHQAGVSDQEYAKQADRSYEKFARLGDRLCLNIATLLMPRVAAAMAG